MDPRCTTLTKVQFIEIRRSTVHEAKIVVKILKARSGNNLIIVGTLLITQTRELVEDMREKGVYIHRRKGDNETQV